MDRREALKKIGVGGITVVGASSIMSSPAFASPGTNDDAASAVTIHITYQRGTGNANTTVTVVPSLSTVTCPESGGDVLAAETLWSDDGVNFGNQGASRTFPGTSTNKAVYTRYARTRVRCLDRNSLPVCSTFEFSFTWEVDGSTTTPISANISAGTLVHDPNTCPQP